ncbi:FUSC family protein, partial [Helicobacter muridarum]
MRVALSYLTKYIHIYDPGYLNLVYALKAMVAIALSVLFHLFIFGQEVIVWAAMTPMQIFFLNATLSQQANRKTHMLGFAICSSVSVAFFSLLAQKALSSHSIYDVWWLALPVLFLSFCVGMSRAYSLDLYRMCVPVVVNSLVACIYVDSGVILSIYTSSFVVFTSALIGIIIGFLLLDTTSNYGGWTKLYYPSVLQSLKNMVIYIDSPRDFSHYKDATFLMIYNIKQTLHTKSGLYNNNYMIKNIKRAIFYIYQIEDIYMIITVLAKHNIHKYPLLQQEIIENLHNLSKIFVGKIPKISCDQASKIIGQDFYLDYNSRFSASNDPKGDKALHNILSILYYKMKSFCRASKNTNVAFNPTPKKNIYDVFKALNLNNATFQFSIKYSLAIALSLVFATLLNINRGIWISLGVVSVVRPSVGGMQNISKEYFISAAVGILIGIIVSVFATPIFFYLAFGIVVFLVVYLRVFPFWLWSGLMMCGFVMMYSILYDDFLHYVLDRLIDIGLGVGFAIGVFLIIWPRYSYNNLKPLLLKHISLLEDMLDLIINPKHDKNEDKSLQGKQADLLHNLDEFKSMLKDSKTEVVGKNNQIVVYGYELVAVLESIDIKISELSQLCSCRGDEIFNMKKDIGGYSCELVSLKNRFESIRNLLNNDKHNFSFINQYSFIYDDSNHLHWLIGEIFGYQNKMYK